MQETSNLAGLAKLIRYYILKMTTEAGSGHLTSSLSAVELMTALYFGKLRFDLKNPENPNNDRVIFSKGHASPLVYALYAAAGEISEKELMTYRKFGSVLEGHPTPRFKFAEAATGSLGQGLSIGVGEALAIRQEITNYKLQMTNDKKVSSSTTATRVSHARGIRDTLDTLDTRDTFPKIYVLMGDSETAEGSVWEAAQIASYYKLGNLVAIVDVNRLGQSGETMLGWDTDTYKRRFEAFGWEVKVIDGHDYEGIMKVYEGIDGEGEKPIVIIAKTVKGKGVFFLENKEGWHGKALSQEEFEKAEGELGEFDKSLVGRISGPAARFPRPTSSLQSNLEIKKNTLSDAAGARRGSPTRVIRSAIKYKLGEEVATRKAFGEALAKLGETDERIVSLDAEVKNSTFSEKFMEKFPERFFECFIAEQNMAGMALGMAKRGKIPFVSTFAAFFTRAFDQIRMSAYSQGNVKFVGSHSGVSIGEDGPSQMGLEDLAMFKAVFGSVVMCPADAVSCSRLVELAAEEFGIFYIRTARPATPVIYKVDEEFKIGGSKVLRSSNDDKLTIVSCGVTLIEAIKAADELKSVGIKAGVIDAYCVKPIDENTLKNAARGTNNVILTVEDHYFEGGLGDSVLNVFADSLSHLRGEKSSHLGGVRISKMAVSKMPMSGRGSEILDFEGISASSIVRKVKQLVG